MLYVMAMDMRYLPISSSHAGTKAKHYVEQPVERLRCREWTMYVIVQDVVVAADITPYGEPQCRFC
jgi:hypothetical protein